MPSAIFDEYGGLRKSSKSPLLHRLAVWCDNASKPDVSIIDGNEMLHRITWPKLGKVQNFNRALTQDHVIVVFDRYVDGSVKSLERQRRAESEHTQHSA